MEYRELPDEDRETFHDLVSYAFQPENPDRSYDPEDPPAEVGSRRALYEDGEPQTVCRHYWFRTRVRGEWMDTPGLSAVATPPENRHRGLVRDLLFESLREYRQRGSPLSLLWPFEYGFYNRYGWETTNRFATVECDSDDLAFATAHAAGEFRRIDADEWAVADAVYDEHAADYALALDRTEDWWRHRIFESWRKEPYVYVWERDGEPAGYLVYAVEDADDGKRLDVWDLGYVDHEAYLNCLRFVYHHDSQVSRVRFHRPVDDELHALVDAPDAVDVELRAGPMLRIVDVRPALERLSYPDGVDAEVTLAVDDPLADWNEGVVSLAVEDGTGTCVAVDEDADDAENSDDVADPDVRLSIQSLSQLYAGCAPVDRIERTNDLAVRDDDARDALARLFPPEDVYLRDFF